MRRVDREVKDTQEIMGILGRNQVCTLSMSVDDKPYGVVLNYGYEMGDNASLTLYFHSATQGRKLDMMRKNPHVAFSIFGGYELVTGTRACEYTARYESVTGEGKICFIEGDAEKRSALSAIMHNHGMGQGQDIDYGDAINRVTMLRLDVSSYAAKRNARG